MRLETLSEHPITANDLARAAILSCKMERELSSRRKCPKPLLTAGETTISREDGRRVHNGVEIGEILIQ